ncbi:MAG: histidine kinase dimerization/phosphoacceptor domain-containing protein, partial [Kitasatospora sp.]|nr:histidine kinase dimerization/phosphoacceptor domain-containing protein [Kitasatospora sp.]
MSPQPPADPSIAPPARDDGLLRAGRLQLQATARALFSPARPARPLLGDARRRVWRRLPYVVAFVATAILLPVGIQVPTGDYGLDGRLAAAVCMVQFAPLLLAVTRPLPAWWISFTGGVVGAVVLMTTLTGSEKAHLTGEAWPWPAAFVIGQLLLLLALALREGRRTLIGVWLVTGAAGLVLGQTEPRFSNGIDMVLWILGGVVLLAGGAVRERREAQRRLTEQETISEAERARRTLLEERARIARELHDVVAHHMSVITVQADSAPYRIDGLPEQAAAEFGSIAATARQSLAEMRRLLGVLRSEDAQGERVPQPGLE